MKKRIWQSFVRRLFLTMLAVFRVLPWAAVQKCGDWFGGLAYRASKRYRKVADKNLIIAFGDALTACDRERITRLSCNSFGRATAEFLKASTMSMESVRAHVTYEAALPTPKGLLTRGRGLIIVTAHLGNFELLARCAAHEGIPILVVARRSDDTEFNRLTDSLRENGGYRVHARGDSPRALLAHLHGNGMVAILPDQKSEDVFVPFFGRLSGTVAGPAVLALKTGAPILPAFAPRQPDGTYRLEFGEEIDVTSTSDRKADTHRIMADVNRSIEEIIRRYPEQWLWLHDRWRTPVPEKYLRPPESAVQTVSVEGRTGASMR